jgi:type I restriction enzyme M protein
LERDLELLRPGGRAAIVLPQGRFNNVTDEQVRTFIGKHARILASVSLHVNTFKPHANIKTSVLFLQKWNDDPKSGALCKQVNDYEIFFACSQKPGKTILEIIFFV